MTHLLELHIERLVLDGLPLGPSERAGLQEAVIQELTRLLGGLEMGDLQAGQLHSLQVRERGGASEPLGVRIAAGVMQGLGGGGQ